jgi:hypothetical protein
VRSNTRRKVPAEFILEPPPESEPASDSGIWFNREAPREGDQRRFR